MTDVAPRALSTIRVRLTAALALALLPILVLGILQSVAGFRREGELLRANLGFAAERSASVAQARLETTETLLQALDVNGESAEACAKRLNAVLSRLSGHERIVRYDRRGAIICAAPAGLSSDSVAGQDWFSRLTAGERLAISRTSTTLELLVASRSTDATGAFNGAYASVIALETLRSAPEDRAIPVRAAVGLVDAQGRYLTMSDPSAFPPLPADWRARLDASEPLVWYGRTASGERRVQSAARVADKTAYLVFSAPSPSLWSWARLHPLTGIGFPLLGFALALIAVSMATDRVVVRWIAYLQRIAGAYAKGRFTVRPIQADRMPHEIRDLAASMEQMAEAIVVRDTSINESLAQKEALLREIHHRVKNNLQVISSLLSMQQRALSDPAARAAMSDARQRITALALIYRALYQGPDLRRVDLRPFLEELTAQLMSGDIAHSGAVRTEIAVDALVIHPDRLAPLALFAVEAISSAQKHAFNARGGELRVEFKVRGDEAELAISDDRSEADGAAEDTGMGKTLMIAFARQLRGRSEQVRNDKGGVTSRLIFPTPSADIEPEAAQPGNKAEA